LWLSHQYLICIPRLSHSCYMPCLYHPLWLDHSLLRSRNKVLIRFMKKVEIHLASHTQDCNYLHIPWARVRKFHVLYIRLRCLLFSMVRLKTYFTFSTQGFSTLHHYVKCIVV
jgi:hypothetical protein